MVAKFTLTATKHFYAEERSIQAVAQAVTKGDTLSTEAFMRLIERLNEGMKKAGIHAELKGFVNKP